MKQENKFYFTSRVDTSVLNLSLYGPIGADMFGDGITAGNVSDALASAKDYTSVTLRVNSPGGDLFEGTSIYNALKACKSPVNVIVDGLAASAASLIAMAGDTITMNPGSVMMVHEAQAVVVGYAVDMRKMADVLDTLTSSAADIYTQRTGMAKDAVLKLMAAETWMSPEQAVAGKFATSVGKDKAKVTNSFDLSIFKNTPIELVAKTKRVADEDLTAGDFIWVGDPDKTETWALPWHFSTEEKTKSHLRDALARFDQEEKIPASEKPAAHEKLVRLATEHGIDVSTKTNAVEAFDDTDIRLKRIQIERRK